MEHHLKDYYTIRSFVFKAQTILYLHILLSIPKFHDQIHIFAYLFWNTTM